METPKSKCKNCGKMTDISESKVYTEMKIKCQVATEKLSESERGNTKIRTLRAGEMNAMHLMFKKLYTLMIPEQRKKAFKLSQTLRDEIKHIGKMK